ncbi:MAG: signal peptidase II [Actinomycetes bacterium]
MYQRRVFIIAGLVLALDQLTKLLAVKFLEFKGEKQVAGNFIKLGFARNPGAAFSFATGSTIIFTVLAAVVCIVIIRSSRTLTHGGWAIALGALLGGALGNLSDRIFRSPGVFRGHVVDFIEFPHYPLFNAADSAIVLSALSMIYFSFRGIELSDRND